MWPDGLAPHVDSLSSRVQLDPKVVDTLLDVVDGNEDGRINYAGWPTAAFRSRRRRHAFSGSFSACSLTPS